MAHTRHRLHPGDIIEIEDRRGIWRLATVRKVYRDGYDWDCDAFIAMWDEPAPGGTHPFVDREGRATYRLVDYGTMAAASPILSKQQNYRIWQAGGFGNKLRAWRTIEEWRASGFRGKVVLRTLLNVGGSGLCRYGLSPDEVDGAFEEFAAAGVPPELIMVNESAPDDSMIIQGEYLNDISVIDGEVLWGWFFYSRAQPQMRKALADAPEWARGLRADLLLRDAMTPSSYEDWQVLLERYPGHALEVSVYGHCLGDIPGRNALVWEVRRY
jgi:hypothetical protein